MKPVQSGSGSGFGNWQRGDVRVAESISASFVGHDVTLGRVAVRIEIDLDRAQTDETTWHEVDECLSTGKLPKIDPSPRRCDGSLALGMLKEVSVPELFALNWDACQAEANIADGALLDAAKVIDLDGMRTALAAGADSNRFHKGSRSGTPAARCLRI